MDDAEDDADGIEVVLAAHGAKDPVEDVEEAVAAECCEVEAVDDGGDGSLAEEEELREDADGFEDDAEGPDDLSISR